MWDSGFLGQSQKPGTVPGSLGLWQSPKSLGQSRDFGTVAEARNSTRPLGLSQKPRVPHSIKIQFFYDGVFNFIRKICITNEVPDIFY